MSSYTGERIATFFLLVIIALQDVESKGKVCEDKLSNCDNYDPTFCAYYPHWAGVNCAKTCGVCTEEPELQCEENWSFYEGDKTCLFFAGIKVARPVVSWDQGEKVCRDHGGSLAIIRDSNKTAFVRDMFPIEAEVWIGLKNISQKPKEFLFQYVDGTYLGDYQPWEAGNPDNYRNNEKCVTMNKYSKFSSGWNDLNCLEPRSFVCQKTA